MIHTGDCIEVMATMPADSVDAVVTDPPYGLEFMGKNWDRFKRTGDFHSGGSGITKGRGTPNLDGPRYVAGTTFQAWCEQWGREALRVTKPGGYLLAFGGTRTHHRLVCGLEDAGWIIRDELDWIYASGFPKGKANLKPAHEPIVLARKPGPLRPLGIDECRIGTGADKALMPPWKVTDRSVRGNGVGENTMAAVPTDTSVGRWPSNVLLSDPELFDQPNRYVVGSGATSTDGTAVRHRGVAQSNLYGEGMGQLPEGTPDMGYGDSGGYSRFFRYGTGVNRDIDIRVSTEGNYPSTFIVPKADRADREPVLRGQLAPQDVFRGHQPDNPRCLSCGLQRIGALGAEACSCEVPEWAVVGDKQRENAHPTVKPTDLMRHLVRLVTPQGGTVLDPFLGSGSTALACELEGFPWIGIEKEPEYVAIAEARLNGTQRGLGLDG